MIDDGILYSVYMAHPVNTLKNKYIYITEIYDHWQEA